MNENPDWNQQESHPQANFELLHQLHQRKLIEDQQQLAVLHS